MAVTKEYKSDCQLRHEKLVDFLSTLHLYTDEANNPIVKKLGKPVSFEHSQNIPSEDIHKAVLVMADVLNLECASHENIDLFRLIEVYLKHPEQRDRFNDIVDELV